jgi:hypothetical protein
MKSFKQYLAEDTGEVKQPVKTYHEKFHSKLEKEFGKEYSIMMGAAKRNDIADTDYDGIAMLGAIRRAENGRQGREFGVLSPKAMGQPGDTPEISLDRQAGWAAASIVSNRKRYEASDKTVPFEDFMGSRWAPPNVANDPTNLNKNWAGNVKKFKSGFLNCEDGVCTPVKETKPVTQTPVVSNETPKATPKTTPTQDPSSPVIPPLLNDPPKQKRSPK